MVVAATFVGACESPPHNFHFITFAALLLLRYVVLRKFQKFLTTGRRRPDFGVHKWDFGAQKRRFKMTKRRFCFSISESR